jgi:hypothetical protein
LGSLFVDSSGELSSQDTFVILLLELELSFNLLVLFVSLVNLLIQVFKLSIVF